MNNIKEKLTGMYKKYSWKLKWKVLMLRRKYLSRMLGNFIVALNPIVMGKSIVAVSCMDYNLYQMVRKKGEAPSRPESITLVFRVNDKTRRWWYGGLKSATSSA